MNQPNPLQSRERARKAFRREHDDIWKAVAGDIEKTKAVRAILERCDTVRDKLMAHYGRHRDTRIAREIARITAGQDRPAPVLKPDGAGRTSRDIEQQAIHDVANRQRTKLKRLNEAERRLLHREVMKREPGRRPVKERGYLITERNARVLEALDRADALRARAKHFNRTRDQRIAKAAAKGDPNPEGTAYLHEAKRFHRINRAQSNVIHEALNRKSFNRVAQKQSGPSMAM